MIGTAIDSICHREPENFKRQLFFKGKKLIREEGSAVDDDLYSPDLILWNAEKIRSFAKSDAGDQSLSVD